MQQTARQGAAQIAAARPGCPLHIRSRPRQQKTPAERPSRLVRVGASFDEARDAKLGPNVAAGIKDVKENLTWSPATVIRNEGVNLDGTHRLLHMSVSEDVDMLYGRKIQAVPESGRWIDAYTVPGQFVGVRPPGQDSGSSGGSSSGSAGLADDQHLFTIACSPYESRRDSAYISGSIIEVVVDKRAGGEQAALADLPPGASVEVSQVVGRGFASLFNSYSSLPSSLEEQRNILALAVGLPGISALRAALNWAPVQAAASSRRVSCFYVTSSPSSAAFLPEWDQWREAGVNFNPLYTESLLRSNAAAKQSEAGGTNGSSNGSSSASSEVTAEDIMGLLEQGLFLHEHGLESVIGGKASEATVLLAGMSGDIASAVAKELTFKGVAWDRMLFCDYW